MNRKMHHFSKLQQHSGDAFALCGGFLFYQHIVNISGITPEVGILKIMYYHLAQYMDSMVPEEKKKSTFQEQFLKKLHSNIAVWYAFKVLAVYKVSILLVCLFCRPWQCGRCFSSPYENSADNRGTKMTWVKTVRICGYLKVLGPLH